MNRETILREIETADMILIGLGEEFNNRRTVRDNVRYKRMYEKIEKSAFPWLIPALNAHEIDNVPLEETLSRFADLLKQKNYFVVSTSTNPLLHSVPWKEHRLVMPCGDCVSSQCGQNCCKELWPISDLEIESIIQIVDEVSTLDDSFEDKMKMILGTCPQCGAAKILNNVYANPYNENGYLEQWELYTKWLTGTLNKNLLILELGVGMNYSSVIRFPFERIALINQKAKYFRVNEKLSALSPQLAERGCSIAENAIDWMDSLC